ncbi:cytochrome b/b6 domain-containing protein [Brevirhabdus sp.]|uniref:cytochrome b/b6 domain-containing protein n=1 Tax=Brevirhabdus sp. TaxID=2004514 RepID=UPI004059CB7B
MPENKPHSRLTRLAHMGLALAVILQLLTSLVMVAPAPDANGNWYFEVHEYSGLTAFAFMLLFWFAVLWRNKGTTWGRLLPWFSAARLKDVWQDTKLYFKCLKRFRLPEYEPSQPLPSAVHGLGLLLITAMAVSGTTYYFVNNGNPDAGGLVGVVMFVHLTLANLVWAYLIGHSSLAVLHHFTQDMSLTEMWSLKKDVPPEADPTLSDEARPAPSH